MFLGYVHSNLSDCKLIKKTQMMHWYGIMIFISLFSHYLKVRFLPLSVLLDKKITIWVIVMRCCGNCNKISELHLFDKYLCLLTDDLVDYTEYCESWGDD